MCIEYPWKRRDMCNDNLLRNIKILENLMHKDFVISEIYF